MPRARLASTVAATLTLALFVANVAVAQTAAPQPTPAQPAPAQPAPQAAPPAPAPQPQAYPQQPPPAQPGYPQQPPPAQPGYPQQPPPAQPGYPQATAQPGYPQQPPPGYPQQPPPGYPQATPQPGYYQVPAADQPPRRKGRSAGLMIAGLATLGGSYLFSVLVGLQLASEDNLEPYEVCLNCDKGDLFYIPIVGPWLFLEYADGTDGKVITAIMGVAQATGVVLTIFGISKFVSSGQDDYASSAPRLTLGFAPTPNGGGQASLMGTF